MPWTNYFDGYKSHAVMSRHQSKGALASCCKSLGWRFDETGDKAPPFNSQVSALRVSIDVSCMGDGKIFMDSTSSRSRGGISSLTSSILLSGRLPRLEALLEAGFRLLQVSCLEEWLGRLCQS